MFKNYIVKFIDRIIHVKFQFLNSGGKNNFNKNYELIDCDWPDTPKVSLPNIEVTKDSYFCLLFENKLYKPLKTDATK